MSNGANHNTSTSRTDFVGRFCETPIQETASDTDALQLSCDKRSPIRHIYVHIPFCARICPYCAFYKDLLDRSQTSRFCEALLCELEHCQRAAVSRPPGRFWDHTTLLPSTIYF